jgi:enoyl-CoA hydratase/carnithine racemase
MTYVRFKLDELTQSLWRVTFSNPPINLIDVRMIAELGELFVCIENGEGRSVVIFDSADPDHFLAHIDISPASVAERTALPLGPTGLRPWLDIVVRLGKLPAVTISAIRARGAGSEFALASDMRFASREKAVLAQIEVGLGAIPGAGAPSWLPRLVGRGRALEILFGGEDFNRLPGHRLEAGKHESLRQAKNFKRNAGIVHDTSISRQRRRRRPAVRSPATQ